MTVEREYDLAERMRELGAEDPEEWAASELDEDIAQEARWLVIRRVREAITWTNENVRNVPEVAALLDAGADAGLVLVAMREVARETAFAVFDVIDEGADADAPDDAPGWVLMETRLGEDGGVSFSGRDLGGLHESLGFPDTDGVYRS